METQIHGRYTVDDVGRLYEVGSDRDLHPSVSTILDVRETPEKLKQWKQRQSNYEEVMNYAQNRGTLVHAHCQEDIIPLDPDSGEPIKAIWGEDEELSEQALKENDEWERFQDELEWFDRAWDRIKRVLGLPPTPDDRGSDEYNTVLDVETYVAQTEIGFAGQFDLLYEDDETNETVLADLKTSKNVYEKNQLQLSAYKMAVPMSIDRMEIIRMNAEQRDWYISSSHDWERSIDDLQDEFIELRKQLEREKLRTIVDTISDIDTDNDRVLYETMG